MKRSLREENQAILAQALQLIGKRRGAASNCMYYVREAASHLGVSELDQGRAHMLSEVMSSRLSKH
jgi:hypothetical protein